MFLSTCTIPANKAPDFHTAQLQRQSYNHNFFFF